ncbi:MAG: branched-chain amino acid ABC transporter permease [Clostridiales Family XIII bacterium]|nr:branched-chain amino acid ABC transporter permease [Clostridiales Family XIII bacterium]
MITGNNAKKHFVNVILIVILVVFIFLPKIVTVSYYLHLIVMSLIWFILISGLNVIQGYTGYVSMCQIAFYGIGAYTSGLLMKNLHWGLGQGILAAVGMGLIVGTIIGFPSLRTKGHYFSIVTLAFTMLMFTILRGWSGLTGGIVGFAVRPVSESLFGIPLNTRQGYYYLVLIFAVLTILFVKRMTGSRTGRAIIAVRENENLASSIGVNVFAMKLLAFDISAVLGCIAGALYMHYVNFVSPAGFAAEYAMNTLLAGMVGGVGTLVGPAIGSFIVIFLPEMLRAAALYRQLAFGIVLIIIVFALPHGVVRPLTKLWTWALAKIFRKNNVEEATLASNK